MKALKKRLEPMQQPQHVKQSPQESRQGCVVRAAASAGSPRAPRTLLLRAYRNIPRLPSPLLCAYVQKKRSGNSNNKQVHIKVPKGICLPASVSLCTRRMGVWWHKALLGKEAGPWQRLPQPRRAHSLSTGQPLRRTIRHFSPGCSGGLGALRPAPRPQARCAASSGAREILSLAAACCLTWGHARSHPETLSPQHVPIAQPDGSPAF